MKSIWLGYFVSSIIGAVVIYFVHDGLWGLLGEQPDKSKKIIKTFLGIFERFIYTTAFFLHKPEWIGFWLTLKVAVTWKNSIAQGQPQSHNIFLTLNALSLIFAFLGASIGFGFNGNFNVLNNSLNTNVYPYQNAGRNMDRSMEQLRLNRPNPMVRTKKATENQPNARPAAPKPPVARPPAAPTQTNVPKPTP